MQTKILITLFLSIFSLYNEACAQELQIESEVLYAIENGPVVLRVGLYNRGKQKYDMSTLTSNNLGIEPPKNWIRVLPEGATVGCLHVKGKKTKCIFGPTSAGNWRIGTMALDPGHSISKMVFFHHGHAKICPGRAALSVEWSVYQQSGGNVFEVKETCVIKKTLEIEVLRATDENLISTREQLLKELSGLRADLRSKPEFVRERLRFLCDVIDYTRHEHFIPVTFELLNCEPDTATASKLIRHVYRCANRPEDCHQLFVKYLIGPNPRGYSSIFNEWNLGKVTTMARNYQARQLIMQQYINDEIPDLVQANDELTLATEKVALSESQIQQLTDSDNIWIRVLALAVHSGQIDKKSVTFLLEELRDKPPVALVNRFNRHFVELDSNDFMQREKGSAGLEKIAESMEPRLRQKLHGVVSLEARRRIERILANLEQNTPNADTRRTMSLLEDLASPETKQLLEAMTNGDPERWRTKEAKAALERMAKKAAQKP